MIILIDLILKTNMIYIILALKIQKNKISNKFTIDII